MTEPKKRGRPPKEGGPMSKAEYQRRYRAKKAQQSKEVYFSLSMEDLSALDKLVEFFGLESRNKLLTVLLTEKVHEGLRMMKVYDEVVASGLEMDGDTKEKLWNSLRLSAPLDQLYSELKEGNQ